MLNSFRVLALGALFASAPLAAHDYRIETFSQGLEHPWSMAFLPDGRLLVTERVGRLRIVEADGRLDPEPVAGVPEGFIAAQAGLMEVALDPDYSANRWLYLTHAQGSLEANNTRLIRARMVDGELQDLEVLFTAQPLKAGAAHYGGRIAFLADNTLVLTLGDGFDWREQAQNPANHLGKIVRLNRDGSVPQDNPLLGQQGAAPEIYSLGHRNVQGIFFDAEQGRLYSHEHGPRGGDELNLIEPGGNYGWPLATFGVDYTGARVSPYTELPGLVAPLLHWTPSVAPSSLMLYRGELFPDWQGDLFASTLAERSVRRIRLRDGMLAGEEVLFEELGERIRDVRSGPDGALYLLTDNPQGRILRVLPSE
ncbi:PQQ-dependent sugar dehydrogenase [Ectopseudomonas khazarica]|uniref:PQQ-dependent sugar dehydrogenase n=1 Tax=Ectopseudomonas khazarica TaxID=2502979 RepID=UPI001AEF6AB3|nr:PQQ-dependent sugar dehydrogenase [Pseudomonas khazarica]QTS86989.1 PQQ-dependent sugar dehydrogenase [Pseudomonas khazarica]